MKWTVAFGDTRQCLPLPGNNPCLPRGATSSVSAAARHSSFGSWHGHSHRQLESFRCLKSSLDTEKDGLLNLEGGGCITVVCRELKWQPVRSGVASLSPLNVAQSHVCFHFHPILKTGVIRLINYDIWADGQREDVRPGDCRGKAAWVPCVCQTCALKPIKKTCSNANEPSIKT